MITTRCFGHFCDALLLSKLEQKIKKYIEEKHWTLEKKNRRKQCIFPHENLIQKQNA